MEDEIVITLTVNQYVDTIGAITGINNPKVVRNLGIVSLITGAVQILLTALFAFLLAKLFGFSFLAAL